MSALSVAALLLALPLLSVGMTHAVYGQTQSQLTVASRDATGASITGYYTVLYSGSSAVATGFTPANFMPNDGASYAVQVDNYGSCTFTKWSDGVTTNPRPFTAPAGSQAFTAVYDCGGTGGGSSSVRVNSVDLNGNAITGYYTTLYDSGGAVAATGFTPKTFTLTAGLGYSVQVDNFGSCTFSRWSDWVNSNPRSFIASSSATAFTAVYNCGSSGGGSGTITVTAHRIPASYWAPCFATACTNPMASCNTTCTGPGAMMYFVLYDSSGNIVATGFADENGHTFSGLNPSATYSVYPTDCDNCHGSTHSVVFQHWGDSMTTRPRAVTATGVSLAAWYSCTNSCAGGP